MPRLENPDSAADKSIENEKGKPEHVPTLEEVLSLFKKLVGENEYKAVRKLEDERVFICGKSKFLKKMAVLNIPI